MKTIVLIPGIDRKIGGKTEIMRDTPIIADHKENLIGSKTKVSQIIADSRVDAKVDNRINHSTVKAVDKVGREIVHFEIPGDKGPVVSRPYKYDRVKQGIIDYHIDKMLRDGTICPINSPYASPVVLTRKNNDLPPDSPEAYRFAIDYRKLNAITKYPRYPLPVIDDLLTNIPHTNVMSTLDLRSGYFQLAISPKDIENRVYHSQWHFCIPTHAFWSFWAALISKELSI
ncbi:retrovirus-related Pol polyprotein from transposon 297 [Trichonephila clavipes]|uniref:Retrovirus-related Pol polyprotein from transposon 297 n=1 Tax=Trichonephila clavipes TaxID=2585209 RepID=A0A8X6SDV1_TRICX|nr:retrovirus-related Pol polyprotein from transposon 297 [Trichonephila clavipes]